MRANLNRARLKKKLSVPEIAEQAGISSSYYYKIEQGIRNPAIDLAKKIAEALDGTVDELFFNQNLDFESNKREVS